MVSLDFGEFSTIDEGKLLEGVASRLVHILMAIGSMSSMALSYIKSASFEFTFPHLRCMSVSALKNWDIAPIVHVMLSFKTSNLEHVTIDFDYKPKLTMLITSVLLRKCQIWPLLRTLCLCRANFHAKMECVLMTLTMVTHVILHYCGSLSIPLKSICGTIYDSDNVDVSLYNRLVVQSRAAAGRTEPDPQKYGPYWPLLQRLSISCMSADEVEDLFDLVRQRISWGIHISVDLSPEVADMFPKEKLEWLKQAVSVQIMSSREYIRSLWAFIDNDTLFCPAGTMLECNCLTQDGL